MPPEPGADRDLRRRSAWRSLCGAYLVAVAGPGAARGRRRVDPRRRALHGRPAAVRLRGARRGVRVPVLRHRRRRRAPTSCRCSSCRGRRSCARCRSACWRARSSSSTTCATSRPTGARASARWRCGSGASARATLYTAMLAGAFVTRAAAVGVRVDDARGCCCRWAAIPLAVRLVADRAHAHRRPVAERRAGEDRARCSCCSACCSPPGSSRAAASAREARARAARRCALTRPLRDLLRRGSPSASWSLVALTDADGVDRLRRGGAAGGLRRRQPGRGRAGARALRDRARRGRAPSTNGAAGARRVPARGGSARRRSRRSTWRCGIARAGARASPVAELLSDDARAGAWRSTRRYRRATARASPSRPRPRRAAGFGCMKLKVGVGDDAGRVAAVRAAAGPHAALRLDANGAWSVEEAVASDRGARRPRGSSSSRSRRTALRGDARGARARERAGGDRRDRRRARRARRGRGRRGVPEDLPLRRHLRRCSRPRRSCAPRRRGLPGLDPRRPAGRGRGAARRRGARLARAAPAVRPGDARHVRGRRRPAARSWAGEIACPTGPASASSRASCSIARVTASGFSSGSPCPPATIDSSASGSSVDHPPPERTELAVALADDDGDGHRELAEPAPQRLHLAGADAAQHRGERVRPVAALVLARERADLGGIVGEQRLRAPALDEVLERPRFELVGQLAGRTRAAAARSRSSSMPAVARHEHEPRHALGRGERDVQRDAPAQRVAAQQRSARAYARARARRRRRR